MLTTAKVRKCNSLDITIVIDTPILCGPKFAKGKLPPCWIHIIYKIYIKRHCIYFNPPWSNNVTTNVGRDFLIAVDECFPKDGPLGKIFNRNTLKISYRTTPNLKQIISKHNKKVLSKLSKTEQPRLCSCPKKATCPLGGHCLEENVIYQATVIETNKQNEQTTETYVGLTAPNLKSRLANHKKSFKTKNI